jgi:hypothetical protein
MLPDGQVHRAEQLPLDKKILMPEKIMHPIIHPLPKIPTSAQQKAQNTVAKTGYLIIPAEDLEP